MIKKIVQQGLRVHYKKKKNFSFYDQIMMFEFLQVLKIQAATRCKNIFEKKKKK